MKALKSKFLPATDTKGARYKAYDDDGNSVTLSADYKLTSEESHRRVILALCEKMGWGWEGSLAFGWWGSEMIAVFVDEKGSNIAEL